MLLQDILESTCPVTLQELVCCAGILKQDFAVFIRPWSENARERRRLGVKSSGVGECAGRYFLFCSGIAGFGDVEPPKDADNRNEQRILSQSLPRTSTHSLATSQRDSLVI